MEKFVAKKSEKLKIINIESNYPWTISIQEGQGQGSWLYVNGVEIESELPSFNSDEKLKLEFKINETGEERKYLLQVINDYGCIKPLEIIQKPYDDYVEVNGSQEDQYILFDEENKAYVDITSGMEWFIDYLPSGLSVNKYDGGSNLNETTETLEIIKDSSYNNNEFISISYFNDPYIESVMKLKPFSSDNFHVIQGPTRYELNFNTVYLDLKNKEGYSLLFKDKEGKWTDTLPNYIDYDEYTLTIFENLTDTMREFSILFVKNKESIIGTEKDYFGSIYLFQKFKSKTLILKINNSETTEYNFSSNVSSIKLNIETDCKHSWDIKNDSIPGWIILNKITGNSENNVIDIDVKENLSDIYREFELEVWIDSIETSTKKLKITQEAKNLKIDSEEIEEYIIISDTLEYCDYNNIQIPLSILEKKKLTFPNETYNYQVDYSTNQNLELKLVTNLEDSTVSDSAELVKKSNKYYLNVEKNKDDHGYKKFKIKLDYGDSKTCYLCIYQGSISEYVYVHYNLNYISTEKLFVNETIGTELSDFSIICKGKRELWKVTSGSVYKTGQKIISENTSRVLSNVISVLKPEVLSMSNPCNLLRNESKFKDNEYDVEYQIETIKYKCEKGIFSKNSKKTIYSSKLLNLEQDSRAYDIDYSLKTIKNKINYIYLTNFNDNDIINSKPNITESNLIDPDNPEISSQNKDYSKGRHQLIRTLSEITKTRDYWKDSSLAIDLRLGLSNETRVYYKLNRDITNINLITENSGENIIGNIVSNIDYTVYSKRNTLLNENIELSPKNINSNYLTPNKNSYWVKETKTNKLIFKTLEEKELKYEYSIIDKSNTLGSQSIEIDGPNDLDSEIYELGENDYTSEFSLIFGDEDEEGSTKYIKISGARDGVTIIPTEEDLGVIDAKILGTSVRQKVGSLDSITVEFTLKNITDLENYDIIGSFILKIGEKTIYLKSTKILGSLTYIEGGTSDIYLEDNTDNFKLKIYQYSKNWNLKYNGNNSNYQMLKLDNSFLEDSVISGECKLEQNEDFYFLKYLFEKTISINSTQKNNTLKRIPFEGLNNFTYSLSADSNSSKNLTITVYQRPKKPKITFYRYNEGFSEITPTNPLIIGEEDYATVLIDCSYYNYGIGEIYETNYISDKISLINILFNYNSPEDCEFYLDLTDITKYDDEKFICKLYSKTTNSNYIKSNYSWSPILKDIQGEYKNSDYDLKDSPIYIKYDHVSSDKNISLDNYVRVHVEGLLPTELNHVCCLYNKTTKELIKIPKTEGYSIKAEIGETLVALGLYEFILDENDILQDYNKNIKYIGSEYTIKKDTVNLYLMPFLCGNSEYIKKIKNTDYEFKDIDITLQDREDYFLNSPLFDYIYIYNSTDESIDLSDSRTINSGEIKRIDITDEIYSSDTNKFYIENYENIEINSLLYDTPSFSSFYGKTDHGYNDILGGELIVFSKNNTNTVEFNLTGDNSIFPLYISKDQKGKSWIEITGIDYIKELEKTNYYVLGNYNIDSTNSFSITEETSHINAETVSNSVDIITIFLEGNKSLELNDIILKPGINKISKQDINLPERYEFHNKFGSSFKYLNKNNLNGGDFLVIHELKTYNFWKTKFSTTPNEIYPNCINSIILKREKTNVYINGLSYNCFPEYHIFRNEKNTIEFSLTQKTIDSLDTISYLFNFSRNTLFPEYLYIPDSIVSFPSTFYIHNNSKGEIFTSIRFPKLNHFENFQFSNKNTFKNLLKISIPCTKNNLLNNFNLSSKSYYSFQSETDKRENPTYMLISSDSSNPDIEIQGKLLQPTFNYLNKYSELIFNSSGKINIDASNINNQIDLHYSIIGLGSINIDPSGKLIPRPSKDKKINYILVKYKKGTTKFYNNSENIKSIFGYNSSTKTFEPITTLSSSNINDGTSQRLIKIELNDQTMIPENMFTEIDITYIVIPNSVTEIRKQSFYNCKYLEKVYLPVTVSYVGDSAFSRCGISGSEFKIFEYTKMSDSDENDPDCLDISYFNVPMIGDSVFNESNLKEIYLGPSIINITKGLFSYCKNIKKIYLKYIRNGNDPYINVSLDITNIDETAFLGCESLESINFQQGDFYLNCFLNLKDSPNFSYESLKNLVNSWYKGASIKLNENVIEKLTEEISYQEEPGNIIKYSPYLDLGLSVLWSDRYLGSNSIHESGSYYVWGELTERSSKNNYYKSSYTSRKSYTTLPYEYDAARQTLGDGWRYPTREEYEELMNATKEVKTYSWGYEVILKNSKKICFPFTGYYNSDSGSGVLGKSTTSLFFSSSVCSYDPVYVNECRIVSGKQDIYEHTAPWGAYHIRPVKDRPIQTNINYVDLGLPSGLLWADRNIGSKDITDPGDSYAWGELSTKLEYTEDNYKFNGSNSLSNLYYSENNKLRRQNDISSLLSEKGGLNKTYTKLPSEENLKELLNNTTISSGENYIQFENNSDNTKFIRFYYNSQDEVSDTIWLDSKINESEAISGEINGEEIDEVCRNFYKAAKVRGVKINPQRSNGHPFIDLGLPSGRLWSTVNLGEINKESEEYVGFFYSWGESYRFNEQTHYLNWNNYFDKKATNNPGGVPAEQDVVTFKKYFNETGGLTTLTSSDDLITKTYGGDWRLPDNIDCIELIDNTTSIKGLYAHTDKNYGYVSVCYLRPNQLTKESLVFRLGGSVFCTGIASGLFNKYTSLWTREIYPGDSKKAYYMDFDFRTSEAGYSRYNQVYLRTYGRNFRGVI